MLLGIFIPIEVEWVHRDVLDDDVSFSDDGDWITEVEVSVEFIRLSSCESY